MSIFQPLLRTASWPRWALITFWALLTPAQAQAAFSGGLESFDGAVKDTDTWVETVLLEGKVVYERSEDPHLKHLFGKDR